MDSDADALVELIADFLEVSASDIAADPIWSRIIRSASFEFLEDLEAVLLADSETNGEIA